MKRRELEKRLHRIGWKLTRHGGDHDVWAHPDHRRLVYVPRHREVHERLAKAILAEARGE